MAQMSSEEALNGIFNILDTMVAQLLKEDAKSPEAKADDTVISLLTGIVEKAKDKAAATVGELLEQLAKGLTAMKEVDHDMIDHVATSIGNVNKVLSNLLVDDNTVANVEKFVDTMAKIGEINAEGSLRMVEFINNLLLDDPKAAMQNISVVIGTVRAMNIIASTDMKSLLENLDKLDIKLAERVGLFVLRFVESLTKANPDDKKIKKLIEPISKLMSALSGIVNTGVWNMSISLNPIRGYLLGRQIGQFLKQIAKATEDMKVHKHVGELGKILDPLVKLADAKNKYSFWNIVKVMNPITGKLLNGFYSSLVDGLDKSNVHKAVLAMAEILTVFFSLDKKRVKAFVSAAKAMDPKRAKQINAFIKELVAGEWDPKKLDSVKEFLGEWRKILWTIVGALAVVVAVAAFAPIEALIMGVGVLYFTVKFMKNTIIDLVNGIKEKDVKEAAKLIHEIGFTIGMLIGMVAVIALITKLVGIVPVVAGLGVLWFTLRSVKKFIIDLADKDINENLAKALNSLKGIAILVIALSVSTAIIAGTIAGFGLGPTLIGLAVVAAIVAGGIYAIKKLSEIEAKDLDAASKALLKLSYAFAIVALVSATLLRPIGKHLGDTILGGIVVMTIIGLGIYAIKKLSKIETEKLDQGTSALLKISGVFALVSLITKLVLIPIGKKIEDAALGGVVVTAIVGLLIAGIWALSKIDQENVMQALKHMAILTLIYIGIALVTKTILIPIGHEASDAFLGAGVTLLITAALIFGVYVLSKVKGKDAMWALLATTAMAIIYLGIALMTKEILIPIGEQTKAAALGAGVTLLIITALILGVWILSKLDGKTALWGVLATAAIAIILLGISLITKEILIPIGQQGADALIGAGIVIGILVIMGVIIGIVGYFGEALAAPIAIGGVIMIGVALIMALTGAAVLVFALECNKINALNEGGAVFLGAAIMVGLIVIMGAIMAAISLLAEFAPFIAIGGVMMIGIGALMALTGATVLIFALEAKAINDMGGADLFIGTSIMIGLIALMGTVMTALSFLAPVLPLIAIGAVVLATIGGIMSLLAVVMNAFIGVVAKLVAFNKDEILEAGEKMCTTFEVLFDIISAAAPNPFLLIEAFAAVAFAVPALAVIGMLSVVAIAIKGIVDLITVDTIHAFSKVVIGDGTNDPHSILGSLNNIIDTFGKIDGVAKAMLISLAIRPIIDTIEQFIDVIMKVATMNYIEGYDDNGKPIYKHLPSDIFSKAAHAVTTSFLEFLLSLNKGFENLSIRSAIVMAIISKCLKPVVDLVGLFVDVVMKVATGTYITGYDKNGNPEYEHLEAEDFKKAGKAVAETFTYFILKLGEAFKDISWRTVWVMDIMGDVMKPIMETVKDFVDTVIKVATMQVVTGYDDKGHPIFELIDVDTFLTAGVIVAETFKLFITNLGEAFNSLTPNALEAMEDMSESIAPVMEGVSSFVDAILKLASGLYIDRYDKDKDGNYTVPHFLKIEKEQYTDAAINISTMFALFIDKLTETFTKHGSFWGNKTEDALEAIGESIAPVMEGVGLFVEAILQLATGTYVDHMEKDKDGKWIPIYKHLTKTLFEEAATTITDMFISFIDKLVTAMNNGDFISKAEDAKDAIQESINPIMQAVKDFSEALKPFLAMTTNDKDKAAKASDYICLQPGKIKQISTGIANAFVSFISIIATNLADSKNKEMYESIKGTAKDVLDVLNIIKKSTNSLSSIIKAMTDDEGNVLNKGSEIATLFTTVLTQFATYFQTSGTIFTESVDSAKSCKKMIDEIKGISRIYADIINKLNSFENDKISTTLLVDTFNKNITKIVNNLIDVSNKSESINFIMIREMTDTYTRIALMLSETSDFMIEHEQMELGINKFITNVKNLTAPNFNKQMQSSAGSIKLYVSRLKEFTNLIEVTTKKIEIYTTGLEAARSALAKLDELLISREAARNKALDNLANKINNIATAVTNMQNAFNKLDENAILKRFEGIRDLLELVSFGDSTKSQNNVQNTVNTLKKTPLNNVQQLNNTNKQVKLSANQPTQNYNSYYNTQNVPLRTSGMVTFEFKDTTIKGFFRQN